MAAVGLGRALKRSQKCPGQMQGKGCALQGTLTCCSNPGVAPSIHEPSRAGSRAGSRMILQSNPLPCQAAGCTFQLIKPKDWGEFHKLNP